MTTVHDYTPPSSWWTGPSKDFRRGRAGAVNLLPVSTGAALATTRAPHDRYRRVLGVAEDL
jgi:glyceraldehyde 3-phosphate dehydrogenase